MLKLNVTAPNICLPAAALGHTSIIGYCYQFVWFAISEIYTRLFNNTVYEVYPKFSGLAAWRENCKWYSSLPLGAVVSLFCECLLSFTAITLCVASQRVFVVVYFFIDSVRKLLDTPSYSAQFIWHRMRREGSELKRTRTEVTLSHFNVAYQGIHRDGTKKKKKQKKTKLSKSGTLAETRIVYFPNETLKRFRMIKSFRFGHLFVRNVKLDPERSCFVILYVYVCGFDPEYSGLNDTQLGVNILKVTSINVIAPLC
jgi:hypothetical protein